MSVEVISYRLSHKGKPVGTHVLKTQAQGRVTLLEGHTHFQGGMGASTVVQRSRSDSTHHASLQFQEETSERNAQRSFDVRFDPRTGLVTARKGPRDEATMPYLMPYRDPLSLLSELRTLGTTEHVRVPMLGKDVDVRLVGEVELETPMGLRKANAYLLHPGGSVVYVDQRAPHVLLKLTQRLADGLLDCVLVKIAEEAEMADWGSSDGDSGDGSKRRRRSRRRRPRRGKRRD